jgi:predicted ester cyclase
MGEDSRSIIRKLFDAFNEKDYDVIEGLAADNFELIDVASGEKYRGREGARKNAEGWLTAFPDVKIELLNVVASGDWAVAEAVGRGTHSGPLKTPGGDVPPTGRQMELSLLQPDQGAERQDRRRPRLLRRDDGRNPARHDAGDGWDHRLKLIVGRAR